MDICVLGGGIGGLTAALAMAQRGAQVTVLEQAEAISEIGAGIQISPNGMAVLRALGVAQDLQAKAVQAQRVELRDYKAARLITQLDLSLLDQDQTYLFLHRADLIDVLAAACRASGVHIRLLQKGEKITPGPRPMLHLASQSCHRADLIVAADGLHSIARAALNAASEPFFTGQVAWRATVPNTIAHPTAARVQMGPKCHLVSYPLRDGALINLVAVQEREIWAEEGWAHQDDPDHLRAAFAEFGGDVPQMLDQVTETGLWGLFRHEVAPVWARDNLALLGDAAHPTLPFMAQGAVMAIEDAWVLADCLSHCEDSKTALALYQNRRFNRVSKIVQTANGNARKYHLSFPPLRWAAHRVMGAMGAIAPRKMMGQFDWIYRHDVTTERY